MMKFFAFLYVFWAYAIIQNFGFDFWELFTVDFDLHKNFS